MDEPDEPEDGKVPGFLPSPGVRVLKAVRIPGSLLVIGLVLSMVGPLPGLGFFLVIGGGLATFVIGMTALVGR